MGTVQIEALLNHTGLSNVNFSNVSFFQTKSVFRPLVYLKRHGLKKDSIIHFLFELISKNLSVLVPVLLFIRGPELEVNSVVENYKGNKGNNPDDY